MRQPETARARRDGRPRPRTQALPLARLRGLAPKTRRALKARGIATCPRLLAAAGPADARAALAREAGIDPGELLALVRRADVARVDGVGAMFQLMLEGLGVADLPALAAADPAGLHARLRALNERERIVRRPPRLGEVEDWVAQARGLPPAVGRDAGHGRARGRVAAIEGTRGTRAPGRGHQ